MNFTSDYIVAYLLSITTPYENYKKNKALLDKIRDKKRGLYHLSDIVAELMPTNEINENNPVGLEVDYFWLTAFYGFKLPMETKESHQTYLQQINKYENAYNIAEFKLRQYITRYFGGITNQRRNGYMVKIKKTGEDSYTLYKIKFDENMAFDVLCGESKPMVMSLRMMTV